MRSQHARPGPAAFLLLLAMLLYVGGVAMDPVVHAAGAGDAAATEAAVAGGQQTDGGEPSTLDHDCELCKLSRGFTPTLAPFVPGWAPVVTVETALLVDVDVRGPPFLTSLRSRAPPSA